MSHLAEHLERYLTIRRALGFKLVNEEHMLTSFVAFADAAGERTITIDTALRWAKQPTHGCHAYLALRMRAVRGFARYVHALDPSAEVAPLDLLPARKYRPTPYIYTDAEILALMQAARRLRPPLRAATAETLRHTFAVKTLLGWYRAGVDVAAKTPLLSTYLGHSDPVATYWYLSASPELLGLAAQRLEHASEGRSPDTWTAPARWAGGRSSRARTQNATVKEER